MVAEGQTQPSKGEEVELLFLLLLLDHPQHNIMLNVNEPPYKLPIFPLSHSFIQSQPSLLVAPQASSRPYCAIHCINHPPPWPQQQEQLFEAHGSDSRLNAEKLSNETTDTVHGGVCLVRCSSGLLPSFSLYVCPSLMHLLSLSLSTDKKAKQEEVTVI